MEITAEYLKKELESLKAQLANAQAVEQQAIGAISLIESLLGKLEKPEDVMTESELAKALSAQGVTVA